MKLLSTFAIVAALLVIGSEISFCQGLKIFDFSNENGTTVQKDEEAVDETGLDYPEKDDLKPSQAKLEGAKMENEDDKQKFEIDDSLSNIETVSELASQNQTNLETYDRTPAQSPFVDNAPHPTHSQGIDPRFVNRQPRQCADDQYLCTKATPTQEHVRCIPNNWKCNGVRDCENNDDEEGCAINHHRFQPNGCVTGYQYQCYGSGVNGLPAVCIDNSKKCNGVYDCTYGDDESQSNCPNGVVTQSEEEAVDNVQRNLQTAPQQTTRPVQSAPTYHISEQLHQIPAQQPTQQHAATHYQPVVNCPNEEHYNRLAWTDRCIRTCISRSNSNNHHNGRA